MWVKTGGAGKQMSVFRGGAGTESKAFENGGIISKTAHWRQARGRQRPWKSI
jgi:hypothetical protein